VTETTPDIHSSIAGRLSTGPERSRSAVQAGKTARRRPPMSEEQRRKLSAAQRAYVATDPRWAEHRRKLADAQIARRMTLTPEELEIVLEMRAKGRTFSYIQEEIGVCHDVIRRELAERGYSTAPVRADRRAKRGTGFWRCFD
jgi:hypothetical protein